MRKQPLFDGDKGIMRNEAILKHRKIHADIIGGFFAA